jgi:hypothetical protein
MALSADSRLFLRDLALLLGLPAVALIALLAWWRPWELMPWTTHPVSEPIYEARRAMERRARQEGIHQADWHGLRLEVPVKYVLTVHEPTLELLEQHPHHDSDNEHWPAQMAFLELDSLAIERFREATPNCSLAPDRCWTESVAEYRLECQRSSGMPDPAIPWTPHLECHVPKLGVRVLINAPSPATEELLGFFKSALARPKQQSPASLEKRLDS